MHVSYNSTLLHVKSGPYRFVTELPSAVGPGRLTVAMLLQEVPSSFEDGDRTRYIVQVHEALVSRPPTSPPSEGGGR